MTQYVDALSDGLVPPSDQGFISGVVSSPVMCHWPFEYSDSGMVAARIMELYVSAGTTLTLPAANKVSKGESILIRNTGTSILTIIDAGSSVVGSVNPGLAQFLYVRDNSTEAGQWGMFTYGAGVAYVSAGQLQGNGTKAEGNTLSVSAPIVSYTGDVTLQSTHRGHLIKFTGGSAQLTLGETYVYGADFYAFIKNGGTGQLLLVPQAGEYVDGQTSFGLQPSESCILLCDGVGNFILTGYGRSTVYQFSQLSLDVSAGGTFTLTSSQASNKMLTFVGNPGADVTVEVPSVVSVYYAANNLSVNQGVTVKTSAGTGSLLSQSERAVLLCDGTNITSAQTAALTGVQSIIDGTESAPALNFVSKPNTGLYRYSTQGFGISVNGAAQIRSNGSGVEIPVDLLLGSASKIKLGNNYGTSGQILFSAGAGSPPYWGDPSEVTSVAYAENAGHANTADTATSATTATNAVNATNAATASVATSVSSITSGQVTSALGYTPANGTNVATKNSSYDWENVGSVSGTYQLTIALRANYGDGVFRIVNSQGARLTVITNPDTGTYTYSDSEVSQTPISTPTITSYLNSSRTVTIYKLRKL